MNEPLVTLMGHVGGQVRLRQAGSHPVADFRLGCTPATLHKETGEWVSGLTQWYTVTVWRHLAQHCADSLRTGDPVLVHGRLTMRTYVNSGGVEVTDLEIDAAQVGHDLRRGTTVFTRTDSPRRVEPSGADGAGSADTPAAA